MLRKKDEKIVCGMFHWRPNGDSNVLKLIGQVVERSG
jgi:hypothetical protein